MTTNFDPARFPMLSSPQNPRVKAYVELRTDGNVRREQQRFFLEGRRGVEAALSLPQVRVHEVIFCEHLLEDVSLVAQAHAKGITLTRVTKDVFKKIADVMTPQGIAAVIATPEWCAGDVFARPDALAVAACGVQDPGNLGTLIRSCEAAGASGLITLEQTADPFNAKVVRATAATLLTLPILRMKSAEFLTLAGKHSARLVATAARGGVDYRKADWRARPIVLCIGSEGAGLPAAIGAACKETVTIPMKGRAESLNAAVAASVLLFGALTPEG